MSTTPPFQILHDLAQKAMNDAFASVSQAISREKDAENQLVILQRYRHEYVRGLQQAMAQGMRSSQCQNTQHFISTLDDAIDKQSGVLGQLQKQVGQERERWMQARRKVASMQALISRDHKRARLVQARREQKSSDEFAARAFRRINAA